MLPLRGLETTCRPNRLAPSWARPASGGSCGEFPRRAETTAAPRLELSGKGSQQPATPRAPTLVCRSWPQACIKTCWQEAKARPVRSSTGRASISTRKPPAAPPRGPARQHVRSGPHHSRTVPASCRTPRPQGRRLIFQPRSAPGWAWRWRRKPIKAGQGLPPGPAPGQSARESPPGRKAGRRGAWRGRRSGEGKQTWAAGIKSAASSRKIFKGAHGFGKGQRRIAANHSGCGSAGRGPEPPPSCFSGLPEAPRNQSKGSKPLSRASANSDSDGSACGTRFRPARSPCWKAASAALERAIGTRAGRRRRASKPNGRPLPLLQRSLHIAQVVEGGRASAGITGRGPSG